MQKSATEVRAWHTYFVRVSAKAKIPQPLRKKRILSFRFFMNVQKKLGNAVETYQNPKKLDDKSGKIEIKAQRKNNQTRTDGIEQRINQLLTADFSELKQNICENNCSDTN